VALMWIFAEEQPLSWVDVVDPHEASVLGSYWNAVRIYLNTGQTYALDRLAHETVGGYRLELGLRSIEEYGRRGEFDFDSIYATLL
jgi:hypothetical protein